MFFARICEVLKLKDENATWRNFAVPVSARGLVSKTCRDKGFQPCSAHFCRSAAPAKLKRSLRTAVSLSEIFPMNDNNGQVETGPDLVGGPFAVIESDPGMHYLVLHTLIS